MNTLIAELELVIRYDVDKARSIERRGTEAHTIASSLAHKAAMGDDVAIGVLADHFAENDHPLTGLLNDIRDGKAFPTKYRQGPTGLAVVHSTQHSEPFALPYSSFVFRPTIEPTDPKPQPNFGDIGLSYLHTPVGHFFDVSFTAPHPTSIVPVGERHFMVPVTPEQVQEYANGLKEMKEYDWETNLGESIEHHLNLPTPEVDNTDMFRRHLREAGLNHLIPKEAEEYHRSVDNVLRYMTSSKEDFYPSLISNDPISHSVFADYLQEQDEANPLVAKLRAEIERQKIGKIKAAKLGDAYSLNDFVLHAIRTGHPNPSVRAFAGLTEVGHPPHSDLLNLLFHSDHPADQDSAVWLSEEDAHNSHSSHSQLRKLNTRALRDAGLQVKVVRGTAYLLDHNQTDHNFWGAPEITFTAPINDHSELADMETHAHQIAKQRAEIGPASVGPVTYS